MRPPIWGIVARDRDQSHIVPGTLVDRPAVIRMQRWDMRHSTSPSRRLLALTLGCVLAAALAGCGGDSGGDEGGGGGGGGSLIFGTSNDPVILDGAYVSDGES